ncbi:MAG TPA: hypothetical protein VGS19_06545 [Streptosporangiaceae bacterium]|nr:hypothetical protein [Streptosporangiaceae bacterium]
MSLVARAVSDDIGSWLFPVLFAVISAGFVCRALWGWAHRCAASWRSASEVIARTEAEIAQWVTADMPAARPGDVTSRPVMTHDDTGQGSPRGCPVRSSDPASG